MQRRKFIILPGSAALGVPMAHAGSDWEGQAFVAAFREGLQNLGWTDCQIIVEEQQCRLQP